MATVTDELLFPETPGFLECLEQPAFLLHGGELAAWNRAAQPFAGTLRALLAGGSSELPELLGDWELSAHPMGEWTLVLAAAAQPVSPAMTAAGRALRIPIGSISNAAAALAEKLEDASELRRYTAQILRGAYQIIRLTENIELAASPAPVLSRQRLDLTEMLSDELAALRSCGEELGFTVCAELPEEPVFVDADAALLNQAFLNLVSNALRHAEPRSELRFALRAEGETAFLSVCSALRRGEKPDGLYRVPEDGFDPEHGAGLGLFAARRVALLHGGNLMHRIGDGTVTATVTLPLCREGEPVLRTPRVEIRRGGGYDPVRIALSDSLPLSDFDPRSL